MAAVLGLHGAPAASAEPTSVLAAQQALLSSDEDLEVKPQASVTVAEAQARLQEVAASRAARAEAEAAAREAARPKFVLPVNGARLTSGYGSRWGTFHYGIDLAAPMRTPEYAAGDGVVLRAGAASGFGLAVYILHENGDVTVYGHMDSILVEPGSTWTPVRPSRSSATAVSRPAPTCTSRCTRVARTAPGSIPSPGWPSAASTSDPVRRRRDLIRP
ncbi:M23 family metallopeptidase [Blastococcus brunescens]|uniref:M23 family metallopeptidase n=1 Tax=Blastococcus brunescens TaxID=1564165 RepID=UPI003BEF214B